MKRRGFLKGLIASAFSAPVLAKEMTKPEVKPDLPPTDSVSKNEKESIMMKDGEVLWTEGFDDSEWDTSNMNFTAPTDGIYHIRSTGDICVNGVKITFNKSKSGKKELMLNLDAGDMIQPDFELLTLSRHITAYKV